MAANRCVRKAGLSPHTVGIAAHKQIDHEGDAQRLYPSMVGRTAPVVTLARP